MNVSVQDLVSKQVELDAILTQKIHDDTEMIMQLADNLAESATMIQGQGYGVFVRAREQFFATLKEIGTNYAGLIRKR